MINETLELNVYSPRGEHESLPRVAASARLSTLNGKKIGILKFGTGTGLAEQLLPHLKGALRKRIPDIEFREWPSIGTSDSREKKLKEMATYSDAIVVLLGFTGTSSARTAHDVVDLEKLGKPVAFLVTRPFQANARFVARREGLSNVALAVVPIDYLPLPQEIEEFHLGDKVAEEVIKALTQSSGETGEEAESSQKTLTFHGKSHGAAAENMEKYFLQRGWSDGLPLVPPTEEAVDRMLEAIDFPPDQLVGLVEPGGGRATIKAIAINAVMAGCLPQYMPILVAAVEALTDPAFDLREVQCTSCNMSPFLIVSGQRVIEELNINSSFSALGPGWRANSTIGRAIRLIMINLGYTWPGKNDMKTLGSPFRFVPLIGENEVAYQGAWEPLRVAEGFDTNLSTVSVMPAMSWQPDIVQPEPPTVNRIVEYIAKQGKVKHDRLVGNWGLDNLVLLCGSTFDCIRREKYSRLDLQRAIYEAVQVPTFEFLNGRSIEETPAFFRLPDWLKEKCRSGLNTLVPILAKPESIKLCVTGGFGPYGISYISTFGYGPAHFVTKPIKLPGNWQKVLEKNRGWESPIVR
jgi:hypothetical protein